MKRSLLPGNMVSRRGGKIFQRRKEGLPVKKKNSRSEERKLGKGEKKIKKRWRIEKKTDTITTESSL